MQKDKGFWITVASLAIFTNICNCIEVLKFPVISQRTAWILTDCIKNVNGLVKSYIPFMREHTFL